MSFSHKTLNSNDITLTSYIANKFWEVKNDTLSENGITIYVGENLPINLDNPFNNIDDAKTSNEEYRRLIFNSVKHLFYKNYISGSLTGSFFQSSSYLNYEQSTIISGTLRELSNIEGTSTNQYDVNLYDESIYDPDRGNKIIVISIDQNIFGSGLNPNSVFLSGSNYYLHDDGEGNFFDFYNEDNYNNPISSSLVGNVFYSQGLIILTNQDYLCILGIPPTAINDYHSYNNMNPNLSIDITANDFSDCREILINSFQSHSIEGYDFPEFTYDNGFINFELTQPNLIPGTYKLGYTINDSNGLTSNSASINLNITSNPLTIENVTSSLVCYHNTSSVPVTFSINNGVPFYSYSLDEGNTYLETNTLFNVIVSGSITASNNNILYAKDYLNEITTFSFSSWYPEVLASINIQKPPCSDTSNDGKIFINNDQTAISASINGIFKELPATFTDIPTGSITIGLTSSFGCVTSSVIQIDKYLPLTASVTASDVRCNGGSDGFLRINFTNVIDNLRVTLGTISEDIYFSKPLSEFNNNSVTASNLTADNYIMTVFSLEEDECQFYSNTFIIKNPSVISFSSVNASYINSCSNQIEINNVSGGVPPYTYISQNSLTGEIYSSTTNVINLETLNGGTYINYIIDSNGCQSITSSLDVFTRQFIYDNPTCETE